MRCGCISVSPSTFRDVEDLLAERGIEVSYETIRCWTIKFGPQIARRLSRRRPAPRLAGRRLRLAGIWMRWSGGWAANGCTCGGPWTMRASSWTL